MGRVLAVTRLCMLCPGICFTTEEKSTENTSVRLVEKCHLSTMQCIDMVVFVGSQDKLSIPISLL